MTYSRLVAGLTAANIGLNRKMLSQIAIDDPQSFDRVVQLAQQARDEKTRFAA